MIILERGKLIVFEGLDLSGKSIQMELLTKRLLHHPNVPVLFTKEPADYKIGKIIRSEFLSGKEKICDKALFHLFLADHAEHIYGEKGILHYLEEGVHVISDRYSLSTLVYQGKRLGEYSYVFGSIEGLISTDPRIWPDLTIYIDVPIKEILWRLSKRDEVTEIFETEEELTKLKMSYDYCIHHWKDTYNIISINGNRPMKEVEADIWKKVSSLLMIKEEEE